MGLVSSEGLCRSSCDSLVLWLCGFGVLGLDGAHIPSNSLPDTSTKEKKARSVLEPPELAASLKVALHVRTLHLCYMEAQSIPHTRSRCSAPEHTTKANAVPSNPKMTCVRTEMTRALWFMTGLAEWQCPHPSNLRCNALHDRWCLWTPELHES